MSMGFYFDSERCIGCKTCQVACKDRFDFHDAGPRPRRVSTFETGKYPSVGMFHLSIGCNHCDSPACVANCPTGAMFVSNEDNIVLHNDEECIGCQTCVNSCPYGAPQYVEADSIVEKCDTCKALRNQGMNPVCVDACPMYAIEFGDMDELRSAHSDAINAMPALPDGGTSPNILVRQKAPAKEENFREVSL